MLYVRRVAIGTRTQISTDDVHKEQTINHDCNLQFAISLIKSHRSRLINNFFLN